VCTYVGNSLAAEGFSMSHMLAPDKHLGLMNLIWVKRTYNYRVEAMKSSPMNENQCLDHYIEPHQRVYYDRKQTVNCAALSIYVISTARALYAWPGLGTCSRDRTNSRPRRTKPGAPQSWLNFEGKSPGFGRNLKRQLENVC
jgi:hypothetical protein